MTTIYVYEDTTKAPQKGIIHSPEDHHCVWVTVSFKPFEDEDDVVQRCWAKSISCHPQVVSEEELDAFLYSFYTQKFGPGRWIRKTHYRLEPLPEGPSCQESTPAAVQQLSISQATTQRPFLEAPVNAYNARKRLRVSTETVDEEIVSPEAKRLRTGDSNGIITLLGHWKHPGTLVEPVNHSVSRSVTSRMGPTSSMSQTSPTTPMSQTSPTSQAIPTTLTSQRAQESRLTQQGGHSQYSRTLQSFVNEVKKGLDALIEAKDFDVNEKNETLFKKLVGFRDSTEGEISKIFREEQSHSMASDKEGRYHAAILSDVGRLAQREANGKPDRTFSSASCENQPDRRQETRTYILHALVDRLYPDLGANSWGLHAALRFRKHLCYNLTRLPLDKTRQFIDDAAAQLKKLSFTNVPDGAMVLHAPAVISWATKIQFTTVCKSLGIENDAIQDPKIEQTLTALEERQKLIGDGKGEHINQQAKQAMLVPMGKLRQLHSNSTMGNEPTTSTRDTAGFGVTDFGLLESLPNHQASTYSDDLQGETTEIRNFGPSPVHHSQPSDKCSTQRTGTPVLLSTLDTGIAFTASASQVADGAAGFLADNTSGHITVMGTSADEPGLDAAPAAGTQSLLSQVSSEAHLREPINKEGWESGSEMWNSNTPGAMATSILVDAGMHWSSDLSALNFDSPDLDAIKNWEPTGFQP
ncbi:hypothetical protein CSUB01_05956 [Colletotrichum sublineola]|uniref:Uncharacterized protein n=1 Tax=Colletotrichum sublineola TaxID=1173701 RepID=A0A066WZC7_COLSU|nr:hypothetical protein CSUB01_05956 [Colletotrichum sublineola]